jgi:isoquinoline 1-oxidoreductase beta subunit
VVGYVLRGCRPGAGHTPEGTAAESVLNAWVRIAPDNGVTIRVAYTEIGQGVHTVLPLVVAEELEVDLGQVRVEMAPCEPAYADPVARVMVTGGSTSVAASFEPLRAAGAAARALLVAAAAERWQVAPGDCRASGGRVHNRLTGASLSYGELAAAAARRPLPPQVELKPPQDWRLLGRDMARVEGPGKVRGAAVFGTDVRVPGMLTGTVLNCPVAGGRLRRVDPAPALALPGVVQVVPLDDAVVVLAEAFWPAARGTAALKPDWDEGPNATLDSARMRAQLDAALNGPGAPVTERGSLEEARKAVARWLTLRYEVPPLAHAALEPVAATVAAGPDGIDVWAPTQVQTRAQKEVAVIFQVPAEQVRIHTTLAGGSFGRHLEVDYVLQAARVARQAGRPVKLIWSRPEDMQHDFYRPPAVTRLEIGLDKEGLPVLWDQHLAVPALRRGAADPYDPAAVEGAEELAYEVGYHRLTYHNAAAGLPVGDWRSVGHSFNAWFIEHALDEVAHASGRDPVALRLRLLARQPRHQAVLREVVRMWKAPPGAGRFRGTAVHASYESVVAQSVEVSVKGERVKVHRVNCAIDCGTALNPRAVRAQMEGGIIFGLTAALFGEITVEKGRVQQQNFDAYRLLSLRDSPEVEVVLVNSGAKLGGVGEAGVPPTAPALCNAVLAATGHPVRRLPIRLKS